MARRELAWWERGAERIIASRPGGWFALNVANPIDQRLLARTNGRVGMFLGQPVGILEVKGAKSGALRRTPLLYLADGERVLLVASKAGNPRHPAWFHNLKANPDVRFLLRKLGWRSFHAREADPEERAELWPRVCDLYGGYEDYQQRSGGRTIPIVVLDPEAGA
jgi:deazaflavin-dependent oxidoreductase (nitroreductase family)